MKDLIQQTVIKNIQDSQTNAGIGLKHGFRLSNLAQNSFPESSFTSMKGHSANLFRGGYHGEYKTAQMSQRGYFWGGGAGGSAFHYGISEGVSDLNCLRNIYAYHARLWNREFGITPMKLKKPKSTCLNTTEVKKQSSLL